MKDWEIAGKKATTGPMRAGPHWAACRRKLFPVLQYIDLVGETPALRGNFSRAGQFSHFLCQVPEACYLKSCVVSSFLLCVGELRRVLIIII